MYFDATILSINFMMLIPPVHTGKVDFYVVNNVENLPILPHNLITDFVLKLSKDLCVTELHFYRTLYFCHGFLL